MMYHKERRYHFLLKYSITRFGCINRWEDFLKNLQVSHVSNCAVSVEIVSQIAHKMPDLVYPLRMANGMLCYEERQPLLLKCFIFFLRCISMVRGAFNIINKPLLDHTMSFLPRVALKLHTKCQILVTFLELEMG